MTAIVALEYENTLVLIDIAARLGSAMLGVATKRTAKIIQPITLPLEEAKFQRQHAEIFVVDMKLHRPIVYKTRPFVKG
jgi:hypothetical protein